jgi:hypothetical protein
MNNQLHGDLGRLSAMIGNLAGLSRVERIFVQELVANLPLPSDQPAIRVARALQLAGVYICVAGRGRLSECACFRDLALHEGKAATHQLLLAGANDWAQLPS